MSARWVEETPQHCAIGAAGPTLNPTDALQYAREDALNNLLVEFKEARLKSAVLVNGDKYGEVTLEEVKGIIAGSFVAGMFFDEKGAFGEKGATYALACEKGASEGMKKQFGKPPYPEWILNTTFRCAVGVAGPTIESEKQAEYAFREGVRRLAENFSVEVESIRLYIHGEDEALFTELKESGADLEAITAKAKEMTRWLDTRKKGPLGAEGVLYMLVCM